MKSPTNLSRLVQKAEANQKMRAKKRFQNRTIGSGEAEVHFLPGIEKRRIVLKVFHPRVFSSRNGLTFKSKLDAVAKGLNSIAQDSNKTVDKYHRLIEKGKKDQYVHYHPDPQTQLKKYLRSRVVLPHVASIRIPKILKEESLPDNRHAVAMEQVLGPNFDELLQASEGHYDRNPRGQFVKKFVKEHRIDTTQLREQIAKIQDRINHITKNWGSMGGTNYVFRLDSFIVEGIDNRGNFKLVLVDLM